MGQIASVNAMKVNQNIGADVLITDEVRKRLNGEIDAKMKEPQAVKNVSKERDRQAELVDNPAIADQESELTKNKDYWKKRLEDLQENHEKIKAVLETERQQGYKDVEGTLSESESKSGEKPCEDNMKSVQGCYKDNAKEPLTCDKEVVNFVNCIKSKRAESLGAKKQEESGD